MIKYWAYILTVFMLFSLAGDAYAQGKINVMLLHSYHHGYAWTDSITEGVIEAFDDSGLNISLDIEYMDTKRITSKSYYKFFQRILQYKVTKTAFDVVICADDNALDFIQRYRQTVFKNIPIIFCGVNDLDMNQIKDIANITGRVETLAYEDTIAFMQQIQPGLKKIYVANDTSTTGMLMRSQLKRVEKRYPDLEFHYADGAAIDTLGAYVEKLKMDTAVLLSVFLRDAEGRYFTGNEAAEFIANKSAVPVYCVTDTLLGSGVLGGKTTSGHVEGLNAAMMALRLIRGEHIGEIPLSLESENVFMIDATVMKKFDLAVSDIPSDAVFVNLPESFVAKYKMHILGAVAVGVICVTLFICQFLSFKARRKAEAVVAKLSNDLNQQVLQRTAKLTKKNAVMQAELMQKQVVQDTLKKGEKSLRKIYDSIPYAVLVHDVTGQVLNANKAARRLLGFTKEQVSKLHMQDDFCTPNTSVEMMDPLWKKVLTGDCPSMELQCRRVDTGGVIDAELVMSPIEYDGEVQILATMRDISGRRGREMQNRLLARAIDESSDGVFTLDREFQLSYVNPAFVQMTGCPGKEGGGEGHERFIDILLEEHEIAILCRSLEMGKHWHGQGYNVHCDNKHNILDVSLSPVHDQMGEISRFVGVCRDVTNEILMEAQLRQTQEFDSLGQLAAGVAKSVRKPAQDITHNLRYLSDGIADMTHVCCKVVAALENISTGKYETALQRAESAEAVLKHMEDKDIHFLMKDMPEAIQQSQQGIVQIVDSVQAIKEFAVFTESQCHLFTLNDIVRAAVKVVQCSWDDLCDVTVQCGEGVPTVTLHLDDMKQVVLNLLLNAVEAVRIQYASQWGIRGKIVVETFVNDKEFGISVADNGVGISEERVAFLLKKSHMGRDSNPMNGQGLAIVYNVVEGLYGGRVEVDNDKDIGTTFTVYLPKPSS
ncbi:MAG: ABC transporter substrate binding protein [Desulfovibrio sp.]